MNGRRALLLLCAGAAAEVCLLLAWTWWGLGNWTVPGRFFWAAFIPAVLTAGAGAWRGGLRWTLAAPATGGAAYLLGLGGFLLGAAVLAPDVALGCWEHTAAEGGFGDRLCSGPLPVVVDDPLSAARSALRMAVAYALLATPVSLLAGWVGRLSRTSFRRAPEPR